MSVVPEIGISRPKTIGRGPGWRSMPVNLVTSVLFLGPAGMVCLGKTWDEEGNREDRDQLITLHICLLSLRGMLTC